MEEVKAYIESGILELYVLGQLSAQECYEVEAMAAKHAEIKAEILAIELAMESYALENAITPSAELENQILSQLSSPTTEKINAEPKIVSLYQGTNDAKIKTLRFALVACLALLVVSVAALISVYSKLNSAHDQIASLSTQRDQFASTVSKLEFTKAGMENRIAMTETDEWATVKLAGVKNSPKAKMLVYWNKNNKNILINYAAMDLPKTDQSHEYQLWALVDGKPVSLGVFSENAKEAVKQMETIEKAQAFAVTIEPMGGSQNPTMEKMIVMGGATI
ncbi:anti-sigma factor [Pedobacter boryungensis]|uniref:Anti-sigma factor n=1 Tax=Pedobacter boryungensis TaxID=869962 RepID=A0ABX2DEP3_9SPHI|nr:anti-sigma factor [Pedobacter boryungensis]NQX32566.1 anti-sigma factor [Pedobacter boryungensis]